MSQSGDAGRVVTISKPSTYRREYVAHEVSGVTADGRMIHGEEQSIRYVEIRWWKDPRIVSPWVVGLSWSRSYSRHGSGRHSRGTDSNKRSGRYVRGRRLRTSRLPRPTDITPGTSPALRPNAGRTDSPNTGTSRRSGRRGPSPNGAPSRRGTRGSTARAHKGTPYTRGAAPDWNPNPNAILPFDDGRTSSFPTACTGGSMSMFTERGMAWIHVARPSAPFVRALASSSSAWASASASVVNRWRCVA